MNPNRQEQGQPPRSPFNRPHAVVNGTRLLTRFLIAAAWGWGAYVATSAGGLTGFALNAAAFIVLILILLLK